MAASIASFAIPQSLFRYRGVGDDEKASREISTVREQYIFTAPYGKMNDPMEGLYHADDTIREAANWEDARTRIRYGKSELGIACFSESPDNQLMWAHYAEGFRGICIEYDFEKLLSGLDEQIKFARVAYSDRAYSLPNADSSDSNIKAILSTKSFRWNYEREWRMFSPTSGRQAFGLPAVKAIFLGSRMEANVEQRIRDDLPGIPLHRMSVRGYSVLFPSASW